MPYIPKGDRPRFEIEILHLIDNILSKGELNYVITKLVVGYFKKSKIQNYDKASDCHGVLCDAAKEFYRRIMAPYEDLKAKQNGDVY